MSEQTLTEAPSTEPLDIDSIRRQIDVLRDIHLSSNEQLSPSECEKLVRDCALELERKINQILSDTSDISFLSDGDLGQFLEHLNKELHLSEEENAKVADEIEEISRKCMEDSNRLESQLEGLSCSLDDMASQGIGKEIVDELVGFSAPGKHQSVLLDAQEDSKFKILELSHQIEKNKITLKSLENLECMIKSVEAISRIDEAFSGLRVIEFEGNCIRLALTTYIPNIEGSLFRAKAVDLVEPSEQNHELLVEVEDGTLELKNVEIFPNDLYIAEIIDDAKSFRQLHSPCSMLETRSSLEWFLRRVQERIILCTLRRYLTKNANNSRHSFEYLDRDEIIVARVVGEIDAFIKVSQGWPILSSSLTLISLKCSSQHSREIPVSLICHVVDQANSLDANDRLDISTFVDRIEDILMKQMKAAA